MSTATITLTAADGHEFAAYESIPSGDIKGRLVVVQEIFGVNEHIRNVCDRFAERGFHAVAPAMFDRAERNFEKGYDQEGVGAGVAIMNALDWDKALADVQATVDHLNLMVRLVWSVIAGVAASPGWPLAGLIMWPRRWVIMVARSFSSSKKTPNARPCYTLAKRTPAFP